MAKKPGIPKVPSSGGSRAHFDGAIKESMEILMGRRATPITLLDPSTATAEDCAKKINEILERLQ